MLWLFIPAVLAIFVLVLLIRTAAFRPRQNVQADDSEVKVDRQAVTNSLCELVRCKTVSYRDSSLEDETEFRKLLDKLPVLFPEVFSVCSYQELEDRALLFCWPGKEHGEAAVMMAHYDVVPVNEAEWEKPAFDAIVEDDVIWGRGTLDTKVTFNGVLSAAEQLIREGFVPEQDVYFAFSGGEEINGKGAVNIVDYFEKNNIRISFVVDEGGAVVEEIFPGLKEPCGLIGIAEKGMMDVEFCAKSPGGHASAPKPGSPLVALSQACLKLEKHPFKAHLTAPVAQMFDTLGRRSTFVYRMIFANLWLFQPVLDQICKASGGELNALMRTTVAFTQSSGSAASNVIPPEAKLIANMRLNPEDTMDSALQYLKEQVADDKVEIRALHGMNPSRISRTDCPEWDKVAKAVASTWRGCVVSPYLMVQCSDSRHYGRISDRVYRFSAMDLTTQERATIHGNNERIRVDTACRAVEFYVRLMRMC